KFATAQARSQTSVNSKLHAQLRIGLLLVGGNFIRRRRNARARSDRLPRSLSQPSARGARLRGCVQSPDAPAQVATARADRRASCRQSTRASRRSLEPATARSFYQW